MAGFTNEERMRARTRGGRPRLRARRIAAVTALAAGTALPLAGLVGMETASATAVPTAMEAFNVRASLNTVTFEAFLSYGNQVPVVGQPIHFTVPGTNITCLGNSGSAGYSYCTAHGFFLFDNGKHYVATFAGSSAYGASASEGVMKL